MEACSSETQVYTYKITRRHKPEDHNQRQGKCYAVSVVPVSVCQSLTRDVPNFAASFNQEANDLTFSLTTILRGATTKTRRQFPADANKLSTLPRYCRESLFSFRLELLFCFSYYFSPLEVSMNKLYGTRERAFLPIH